MFTKKASLQTVLFILNKQRTNKEKWKKYLKPLIQKDEDNNEGELTDDNIKSYLICLSRKEEYPYLRCILNLYSKEKRRNLIDEKRKRLLDWLYAKDYSACDTWNGFIDTVNEIKKDIQENEKTKPVLSYSTSKAINEDQLKKSGKNYVILRLGSVYGYSTDSMRIDIMPNLFSKITSQNGTLKLFASGRQIKSLVPLIDVARCFKFMEE